MAAPRGNRNRAKDKLVEAALRRELTQNPEDALAIARACIDKAKEGDVPAMAFIRDTVDGKPTEHVNIEQNVTFNVGDTASLKDRLDAVLSRRQSNPVREPTAH